MYKKFISAMAWNSINIFIYKAILLLHQIILFYFMPHELYGVSGALFAALYLLIGCTNFGFEYSLFTFFAQYTKNKQSFHYLLYQCTLKVMSTLAVAGVVYKIVQVQCVQDAPGQTQHGAQVVSFLLCQFPTKLLPYLLAIFIAESIRKYLETIAQLAFLNKQITIIQVSMICSYVILVWSSYVIYGAITLGSIFIPMVITACAEVAMVLVYLYKWYKTLPSCEGGDTLETICATSIAKEQLFNYVNQLSKNLFSPNFLMVLIAYHVGMQQTGNIRFFTNIITLLYMLFNRSIAIPSGALFSSINQESFTKTKQLFLIITNTYLQFLYALALIITTTVFPMIVHQPEPATAYLVLLFILAGFIEYITITYEKLYIVQHKAHQLAFINACSAAIFIIIICTTSLSAPQLLLTMCVIRMTAACLIGFYAYKKWDICPQLMISFKTLLYGLTTSLALNFIMKIKALSL